MNFRRTGIGYVAGLLAMLSATAATAQDRASQGETYRGFYGGLSLGVSDLPDEANIEAFGVPLRGVDAKSNRFTYGLNAGYRFGRWFALDAGYVDFNEASARLEDATGANRGEGEVRYSVKGTTAALVAFVPFGKWDPYLKVGVLLPVVKLSLQGRAAGNDFDAHIKSTKSNAFWGLGVGYHFNEEWSLKLGLDSYSDVGNDESVGKADITTYTLGMSFRF